MNQTFRHIAIATVLLALCCASPRRVAAEPLRGVFTEYSSIDGLAHNNIHDIYTDSRGFVWLCTWSGVSRFDGYSFKNYCTDPKSMPVRHNRFRAVVEDSQSNLWFRTYDDHIYRFNRKNETFEDVCEYVEQLHGLSYRVGQVLCCNHTDRVWVEYVGFGLVGFYNDSEGNILCYNLVGHPDVGTSASLLSEDSEGNLWAVSNQNSIIRIAPDGVVSKVGDTEGPIKAHTQAGSRMVYATDNSLLLVDTQSAQVVRTTPFHYDTITTLAASYDGERVYVGTLRSGMWGYDVATEKVEYFHRGALPTRIRNLTVDSHGTVWITDTKEGITRFSPEKRNYKHFSQKRNTVNYYSDTTSMVIEQADRVWIKMNHVGFGYYDRAKDSVEPFYNDPAMSNCRMTNGVANFEVGEDGVLWLSTYYERGLQRIVLQKDNNTSRVLKGNTVGDNTYSDEVRAVVSTPEGKTWVGTKEGHLYCFGPNRELLFHYSSTPQGESIGPIYTIKPDSKGYVWVGTKGNGLYRLTPPSGKRNTHRFKHFRHSEGNPHSLSNDQVYCIEEDSEGRIWVATYGGAINMLPSSEENNFYNTLNSFPHYPTEPGEKARYIICESPQRMLVGTSEGLIVFNPSESPESVRFVVAQRSTDNDGLKAGDIIHILKSRSGEVWLSTYGGGLCRIKGYNTQGLPSFETFSTSDGLSSNIVLSATEAVDGAIWLATERGISKFEPEKRIFTNYTRYDGFKPNLYNEAAAATDSNGNLLFGSVSDLHIINPEEITQEDYDYKLHFTSLEVQNQEAIVGDKSSPLSKSIAEGGGVRLPWDYTLFRIQFASLNYRLQNRVNYLYILDGYDTEWTDSHNINSAYYSKVPPGEYTFRVKAYVGNPQMAGEEISLPIHIVTPPWLSWWAWCLYVALAVGVLWFIGSLYLRMAKLRTDARVEQDTAEMKLKFFTNISHELRTPLTLIMGGIEEVQKHENLSPRAENSLTLSYKNSKRMLSLINQILDFRKVVKNKMELCVERLDIVEVAKGVMDDFRDLADERKINLMFSFSHESINIWGDRQRLESLIYNLVSNALKFTHSKGTISLSLTQSLEEECVRVVVQDNGIGIPKEQLSNIFERFAQYSPAVRGDMGGSGIGLSLSQEIVELHKGTIGVESKVGHGTTFTISLPLGNAHFEMNQIKFADESETPPATSPHKVIAPPEGAQKILLVEDNNEMRTFIYNNLIDTYKVVEATNGVEALAKINAEQPDIVITDLMMPEMDGIELVENIRKNFETSHIPVVMLTAKQTPEDRILAMKYGADGYITKPFSMELLLVRIDNLLTQRRLLFEKISKGSARNRIVEEAVSQDVVVTNKDEQFLQQMMAWIEENIENSDLTIDDMATHMMLGRTTMYNKIKSLTGKSPVELIKEYRVTKSEVLLRTGQFSVAEVAYQVGFSDPGYFSRCFKEQYKSSPVEYLKKLKIKQEKFENQ